MRKGAALVLLLAGGCYIGPPRYYSGPPAAKPPPPPAAPVRPAAPPPAAAPAPAPHPPAAAMARMVAEPEAVAAASDYARKNGFAVSRVKHVHLDGAGRWHVELIGDGGRDKAKILVDGWTGQILKANLKDEEE